MTKAKKSIDSGAVLVAAGPYYDRHRHTILKFEETKTNVRFTSLDIVGGLKVVELPTREFYGTYKPIPNYPIAKAVQVFLEYAKTLGATKEVMELFAKITTVTEEMTKLATTRRKVDEPKIVAEKPKKEPKKIAQEKPSKQPVEKKPAKVKESKSAGSKKSAAQTFKDLIMDGKLTDREIFKKVQDEFALDDSKFGYVKWYRNNLIKSGMKPPAAKGDK
jgi:hypothetical protein